jgi:nucleotide-binding universal stress UspA family protein
MADPTTVELQERQLAAAAEPVRAAGVDVAIQLHVGSPVAVILEQADRLAADLIVLGTHGTTGFEHLLLGSVTEKVLRKARAMVLTVPAKSRSTSTLPFKRIVCAVDFGESSRSALRSALSLAQESDAELTVVHVLEWPADDPSYVPRGASGDQLDLATYRRAREEEAARELERIIPPAARDWCAPTSEVRHGKPYEQILSLCREHDADLLVMGVRGRNAIDVLLFGSTTNQVVRRATCPVLTIRH